MAKRRVKRRIGVPIPLLTSGRRTSPPPRKSGGWNNENGNAGWNDQNGNAGWNKA